jgi:hypothetical protein
MADIGTAAGILSAVGKIFGGGEKDPNTPYNVCGLSFTRAQMDAAKAANLPGVPQFDGGAGWSDADCARMRAYLASNPAPLNSVPVAASADKTQAAINDWLISLGNTLTNAGAKVQAAASQGQAKSAPVAGQGGVDMLMVGLLAVVVWMAVR